ncbi:hypothetical protein [Nocardia seriolae]|uniref:Uncharacterized protein n=1 Tax=Nocardia seriolae TaxID=37332 RepID=A0A0B8NDX1_9NOCA|nr:hypothetical protein [Nocardia seriolae]APB00018.1 hypothetical protein NS506_05981 [Nocardia seriolae]MTJ64694.1 hypothetical protein [Nocardia seriolae]MTJ72973.1 hypothetical protein [Nocardia seriolae]MTJ89536.1 hypothetical protein [Nocardia seriolae]MTK33510.1 hypothetical protein [Nocardia seriolae]
MKSTTFTAAAAALTAAAVPALLAPSAAADTSQVRVDNVSDSQQCGAGKPCYVRVRVTGENRMDQVTVSVNNTVIGYAVPVQDNWDSNAATASVTWVPQDYGTYTISATQDSSSASIGYTLNAPPSNTGTGSFGGLLPSGSAG